MSRATEVAAHNLRVDDMTAEVLRALGGEGVESILLKGPSTVRWLWAERPRRYLDCDLLVSPDAIAPAHRALRALGFVPAIDEQRMPAWWREHSVEWRSPERFTAVDLHRTLKGVGVDERCLWDVLRAETETMAVGGFPSAVLSLPARCVVLAVSTADDGVDKGDLARAVERAGEATWRDAARLAADLDALMAFTAGLEVVPRGHALVTRLAVPRKRSVDVALRAGRAPAEALTIDRLTTASGPRERLAIARHKLVPPRTFMRHWSPRARRGRAGLLFAYLERLLWVARRAPRALLAWRRARRVVQEEPRSRV